MVLHYLANKYHAFFLYLFFQFFLPKSSSSLLYVYHCSTNKTFTANSAYHFNLDTLLASLSTAAATGNKEFLNTTAGATPDTVYGLFLCRGDVPRQVCRDCVAVGTQKLASEVCQLQKEGIIWQGECLVRYSNRRFFSLVEEEPRLGIFSTANVTENAKSNFTWTLASTLTQVVEEAANCGGAGAKKFAAKRAGLSNVAESKSLYAAAECTWDLSSEHCHRCLRDALRDVQWCCLGKAGGRLRYPSCGLRFELYQFYWDMATANSPLQHTPSHSEFTENEKVSPRTIFIVVILLVVVLAMLSSFCYLLRRKARKKNEKILLRENFGDDSVSLEGLQFDLAIIEEATNNFSHENKIGKGGFGEVYKGILPDGRHIAVKRLSTTSTQGSVEFKNEILLIAKLQHRNLVTLIGFCLEVQEKILIYEYMTNGSLDNLLFGLTLHLKLFNTRQNILSWSERYKIIEGIAQGILYLHEYSRLKVIHRDLKPSNILLDKNMNPKISDFGMARIIELDQDREKTKRIVGTYGYMSPEYAMLGQFSEKSDVFSFGVMVLEIITGKKNINSHESLYITDGLMNYVWRQWKDQKQLSILDPNLKEDYSHNEVIKCIQIGLQCVQENQNIRPTMVTVVSYLDGHTLDFPSPQEPSFFLQDMMDKRIATPKISIHEMSMSTFCPR